MAATAAAKRAFVDTLRGMGELVKQLDQLQEKYLYEHEEEISSWKAKHHQLRTLLSESGRCSPVPPEKATPTSRDTRSSVDSDTIARQMTKDISTTMSRNISGEVAKSVSTSASMKHGKRKKHGDRRSVDQLGPEPEFSPIGGIVDVPVAPNGGDSVSLRGIRKPPSRHGSFDSIEDVEELPCLDSKVSETAQGEIVPGGTTNDKFLEEDLRQVSGGSAPNKVEFAEDVDGSSDEGDDEESSDEEEYEIFVVREAWNIDSAVVGRVIRKAQTVATRWDRHRFAKQKPNSSLLRRIEAGDIDAERENTCILHPQCFRRLIWDLFALTFLAYDLVVIPISVFDLPDSAFYTVMDWLILLYWTLDMGMSCITGYYIDSKLIMDFPNIPRHYAKGWLPFDILVLAPEWFSAFAGGGSGSKLAFMRVFKGVLLLRLLRFFRLLRLVKFQRKLQELKARVNNHMALLCITISKLSFGMFCIIHILACAWYAIGKVSTNSWIYEENIIEKDFGERYLYSFQWSMARLHPSSFAKNMTLQAVPERIFSIFVAFMALGGGGIFISSITNTMAQVQNLRQVQTRKMHVIREYCSNNHISLQLSTRVKKYVEKPVDQKLRVQYASELADFLPTTLLMDLRFETWMPFLTVHPFFLDLCTKGPRMIWCLCKDALVEQNVLAADTIFTTGDSCSMMYLNILGKLTYVLGRVMGDGRRESRCEGEDVVVAGQWLSEAVLWTCWHHYGELTGASDSTLLVLKVHPFLHVSSEHERVALDIGTYARGFVHMLDLNKDFVSDFLPATFVEELMAKVSVQSQRISARGRSINLGTPGAPTTEDSAPANPGSNGNQKKDFASTGIRFAAALSNGNRGSTGKGMKRAKSTSSVANDSD